MYKKGDFVEEGQADQAGAEDLPAADEESPRARRLEMSEVRILGKPASPPQDQAQPAGE